MFNFYIALFQYRQWDDPKQRRLFFEKFAKKHGFDTLIPEQWRGKQALIMSEKVRFTFIIRSLLVTFIQNARVVLSYYGLSVYKALTELFTEVEWTKTAKSDLKIRVLSVMYF